ncbi:MAG TPA: hypothetical protein VGM56_08515, partial [Byssovorax sp.]
MSRPTKEAAEKPKATKTASKAEPAKKSTKAEPEKAAPEKAEPKHAAAPAKAAPAKHEKEAAAPAAAPKAAEAKRADAADDEGADVSGADAAYARLEAAIAAIADADLVKPYLDAQQAALVALSAATRLEEAKRRATIEALAKLGLAKLDVLDGLRDAALATWHARRELLEASATDSRAALPGDLRAQAVDCRKRMRSALEYNVRDPQSLEVMKFLRAGRGDLDLANDLVGYAKLYRERRVDLERDKVNYRANDEALAKRLAGEMGKKLGVAETTAAKQWSRAQSGAFTLLVAAYAEASRVGRFVDRD